MKIASLGQFQHQIECQRRLRHRLDPYHARMADGAENLDLALQQDDDEAGPSGKRMRLRRKSITYE